MIIIIYNKVNLNKEERNKITYGKEEGNNKKGYKIRKEDLII